jgi:Methyltransferase domain
MAMRDTDPYRNVRSIRFKYRQRRFLKISGMIDWIIQTKGKCRILDLGGSEAYWLIARDYLSDKRGKVEITLVNLELPNIEDPSLFRARIGDACNVADLEDNSFDLVHSNSVIEHVGSWGRMKSMAQEVRRLAPHYYVQSPYFWFPFEPHYTRLCYHWLPQNMQAKRLLARGYGFIERKQDIDAAMETVQHTILLDKGQFAFLFPDGRMEHEIFLGLTKSLIAIR